jgi:hypothetical protein
VDNGITTSDLRKVGNKNIKANCSTYIHGKETRPYVGNFVSLVIVNYISSKVSSCVNNFINLTGKEGQ